MNRWYAWVENQIYGPYAPEQLAEFVQPEMQLCREGSEEWKIAKDFPELAFLWSGAPLEPPPTVGWLVKKSGSADILGPVSKSKLTEMIHTGELGDADSVKHTDWDEWETVGKTKLVAHKGLVEKPDQLPSPEGFHKVVLEATNEELMKEYKENYKLYARRERKILKEELLRRGLIKKTLGLF